MAVNVEAYQNLIKQISTKNITLVAVSKTKPVADIKALYHLGQKDFGENYVQELVEKQAQLSSDIRWHYIGHLQSNKVKYIAPFVHLIHAVDSFNLLKEINKQAAKNNRIINCLLQVHIAQEETKFGFDEKELHEALQQFNNAAMKNVNITGLMGMASFTNDAEKIRAEFKLLKNIFDKIKNSKSEIRNLSMGMSADYKIAIEEGSTIIRVGSLLFGARENNHHS